MLYRGVSSQPVFPPLFLRSRFTAEMAPVSKNLHRGYFRIATKPNSDFGFTVARKVEESGQVERCSRYLGINADGWRGRALCKSAGVVGQDFVVNAL